MQQQRLWLEGGSALSSQLHPAEQVASWAPSKPSVLLMHLMQASRTAAEAAVQLVPSSIRATAQNAWAKISKWLSTCATWTSKEQPKLTPLHGAVFLAHDSANVVLHGLRQAAGSACVMAEHAGTRWHMAIGRASAGAAHLWDSLPAMLRFSSAAAMTDGERDAYLAAKSAHKGVAGDTLPESRAPKGIRSWWGSLTARNMKHAAGTAAEVRSVSGPSADVLLRDAGASAEAKLVGAPQREAEYSSEPASTSGLTHVQTADGGSVMWAGQPGQSGQPGEPEGLDIVAEGASGLQDAESAAGGLAPRPEQSNAPAHPIGTLSEAEDASTLHHVQSERGGSVTWQGRPAQQQSEPREAAHTDAGTPSEPQTEEITTAGSAALKTGLRAHSDAEVACGEEHQQTAEEPAAASRGTEHRGDQDTEAEACERSEACIATAAREVQAQHTGVGACDLETGKPASAVQGMPGAVGECLSMQPSGRQDVQQPAGQIAEGAAADSEAEPAASRGSPASDVRGKEGSEAPGNESGAGGGESSPAGRPTDAGGAERDIAATLADAVHSLQIQHAQPPPAGNTWMRRRSAEARL